MSHLEITLKIETANRSVAKLLAAAPHVRIYGMV